MVDGMWKGKKMIPCTSIIKLLFAVLLIHNAQGYSNLPALKNYNLNATSESAHIKRILAFGDSLTEGYLSGGRKFYPYTTKLEEKLNSYFNWTRFEVLNEGISGECVFTEMVTRLPKVLNRAGNRVDLVIILGGTNDFHKLDCVKRVNVAHEVISLHKIVHKAGIRSVLVTIPECSSLGSKCDKARVKVNEKLRGYAKQHANNTLLCDLGKYMPLHNMSSFDRKVYWDDDVHPSKIGYDKIAALLFHTIREWLTPAPLNNAALPDDVKDKTVPDPDPINKHKSKSQKKKQRQDKKLAKALVTDTTPLTGTGNTTNYNAGATSEFSNSQNSQAISALPSIATTTSTAADTALPSTNPKFNDKTASSLKPSKSTHKHKHKSHKSKYKNVDAAAASPQAAPATATPQAAPAANPANPAPNPPPTNFAPPIAAPPANASPAFSASPSTSAPSSNETQAFSASPSASTPSSNATLSLPSTASNTTYPPPNQYLSSNGTFNNNPNGTTPISDSNDAGDWVTQFPDYASAYAANPSSNYTQPPPSTNSTYLNTQYSYNNTNNAAPNATASVQSTGEIGDLQKEFPEYFRRTTTRG